MKQIAEFESAHHRTGTIALREDKCDVCGAKSVPVIAIDSSEGEYGEGCICKPCAVRAFEGGLNG